MITLLMHWYTPLELAKRMGFYHSCQAIGSMMSGALQAAIMSTLDGHSGLEGASKQIRKDQDKVLATRKEY